MIAVTLPGSEILDFRSPEIPPRQDECFGLPDRSRGDPTRLPQPVSGARLCLGPAREIQTVTASHRRMVARP